MELRIKDVAKLLKVSEKTIYRWVKEESIPFYQVNHQYRFDRLELNEWIMKTSRRTGEEPPTEGMERSPILLSELLDRGGIHYMVEGTAPQEIFQNAFKLINLPTAIRKDQMFDAIIDRENLMTTAMGDGIALPHPRIPNPAFRGYELISLCFLETPVDFGALDGVPVHTLFFIFTSDTARHLETITKLGYLCKKPQFLSLLRTRSRRSEIMAAVRTVDEQWVNGGTAPR